jgi:hypothetical protein
MIDFFHHIINKPVILTMIREPLSHTLSWLAYFRPFVFGRDGRSQPAHIIQSQLRTDNLQCRELGITTDKELDAFIASGMDLFDMICVTEHFDECMVMLRRRMNWDMVDITYLRIHDANEPLFAFICSLVLSHIVQGCIQLPAQAANLCIPLGRRAGASDEQDRAGQTALSGNTRPVFTPSQLSMWI